MSDLRRDANMMYDELAGLQNIVNANREFRLRWLREYERLCGPLEPIRFSRRQRFALRVRDLRRRVALRIAPWLDEDY